MPTFNSKKQVFARERITVTSGAVKQLTSATFSDSANIAGGASAQAYTTPRKASGARLCIDSGGSIHFTENGTDPTTGVTVTDVGTPLNVGDVLILESYEAIVKFKAIALSTSAIVEVVYFR